MKKDHQPRKRFGQNFLIDQRVISQIISAIGPKVSDNLIEIGPGTAALTEHLIKRCPSMSVLELDRDLVKFLATKFAAYPEFTIHSGDALEVDFSQFYDGRDLRLVGNLPYNISTPILFHLLQVGHLIKDMHFMLQREVVERLAASPGCKDWGRLGIMTQYQCAVTYLFDVPPEAFFPPPKVQSAIVRLVPHTENPHPPCELESLRTVVRSAFAQRRKTLRNNFKEIFNASQLVALNIDPAARAETLPIADFVGLANLYSSIKLAEKGG